MSSVLVSCNETVVLVHSRKQNNSQLEILSNFECTYYSVLKQTQLQVHKSHELQVQTNSETFKHFNTVYTNHMKIQHPPRKIDSASEQQLLSNLVKAGKGHTIAVKAGACPSHRACRCGHLISCHVFDYCDARAALLFTGQLSCQGERQIAVKQLESTGSFALTDQPGGCRESRSLTTAQKNFLHVRCDHERLPSCGSAKPGNCTIIRQIGPQNHSCKKTITIVKRLGRTTLFLRIKQTLCDEFRQIF